MLVFPRPSQISAEFLLMAKQQQLLEDKFHQHRKLAEQGCKESQYWTGLCYHNGEGVPQDRAKAFMWFQRSAKQTNSGKSTFRLGDCYLNGYGVDEDVVKGNRLGRESIPLLMEEASQQEGTGGAVDGEAMYLLARAYLMGLFVQKDQTRGLQWMRQAAEQEHGLSQAWIALGHKCGNYGLERNRRLEYEWFQRSARNGDKFGCHGLACCFHHGHAVVARDWMKALQWYQAYVELGFEQARVNLNSLWEAICTKRDRLQALVNQSLSSSATSHLPLGLWGHALATLAAPSHQPAGFTPTFVALSGLVPEILKNRPQ